jgi:cyclic pyranopterin phosphate synthase
MPAQHQPFMRTSELLTPDELLLVVRAAAAAGFRKVRLTGGEPALHPHLLDLVRAIKTTDGIEQVAMTTNGLRLGSLARPLKKAGLDRVNISLDSLDPQKFRAITRGGQLIDVWAGIEAALDAGLHPVRLNTVIVRGLNDDEIVPLAHLTGQAHYDLRFIEMMPFSGTSRLAQEAFVSSAEVRSRIEAASGPLEVLDQHRSESAVYYRIPGTVGKVGFISSISAPFCGTCNRMRLTADGKLHLCLLHDNEVDLRAHLRAGASQHHLEHLIRQAVAAKPWGHQVASGVVPTLRGMSQLGG